MGLIECLSRVFSCCRCCCCGRGGGDGSAAEDRRLVLPGHPNTEYCDNRVKSSKYTLLTFLPMNFFEQFSRPINFYFLLLTILQSIPSVAPVSPLTTLIPLSVAFLITAVKEGMDDWKRHRLDREFNTRRYNIVDTTTFEPRQVSSADIHVGDLLLLRATEVVPCDVVLLVSSGENGEVHLSTEALDGETVSKERVALLDDLYTQQLTPRESTMDSLSSVERSIESAIDFVMRTDCRIYSEVPNPFINSYSGTAHVAMVPGVDDVQGCGQDVQFEICTEHVALASSVIKNTYFALGVAVNTGNETKVAMTRSKPPTKWSMIDQLYNRLAIAIFALQFVFVVVYATLADVSLTRRGRYWYFGKFDHGAVIDYVFVLPSRFFSLVSPMVPLSFKVLIDASKAYISEVIKWDVELGDGTGGAGVQNSSLMEDLGQIEYIMSDKTGTLTRNNMKLHRIVLPSGQQFIPGASGEASALHREMSQDERIQQLLRVMIYCNTVEGAITQPSDATDTSHVVPTSRWASSSPDEVALVEGSALFGVKLLERKRKRLFASFGGRMEAITVLKILKFTPERRRVSVLLRIDGESGCLLLTKGSDESVLPRCVESPNAPERLRVAEALDSLSRAGLRTLVAAYRVLDDAAADAWLDDVGAQEALTLPGQRVPAIARAHDRIECGLTLCGVTAVEDKLQDKVPATIAQLRWAGLRVWMLTGDKGQTARQSAVMSGMLAPEEYVTALTPDGVEGLSAAEHMAHVAARLRHIIAEPQFAEAERQRAERRRWVARSGLKDFIDEFLHGTRAARLWPVCHPKKGAERPPNDTYNIALSGKTVELVKECGDHEMFEDFKRVLLHASTVICSRMTPDEKAFVVQIVKDAGRAVLAIGDGGNDVAMIQCAHVGVGIKGKEGIQAAAAADFSISQFRFLARLLLFHGHMAYQRSSVIVHQSFWKTVSLAWVQMLYNLFTDFSGMSFWDSFSLTIYNSLITVPVTFLCAMNMPLSASTLLNNPQLYVLCQRGRYFSAVTFYGYVLRGFLHGTVLFFMTYIIIYTGGGVMQQGYVVDRTCDFYVPYFAIVTLHSCVVLLETHTITLLHWTAFAWSILGMFASFIIYAIASPNHSFITIMRSRSFYLQWVAAVAVPLFTLSIYVAVKLFFFPDLLQLQRLLMHMMASESAYKRELNPFFQDDNPSRFFKSFLPRGFVQRDTCQSHSTSVSDVGKERSFRKIPAQEEESERSRL